MILRPSQPKCNNCGPLAQGTPVFVEDGFEPICLNCALDGEFISEEIFNKWTKKDYEDDLDDEDDGDPETIDVLIDKCVKLMQNMSTEEKLHYAKILMGIKE